MRKLYCDCESVGLNGPMKLLQWSWDDEPVSMFPLFVGWEQDEKAVEFLKGWWYRMNQPDVLFIAFNAVFDLAKLYFTFAKLGYREPFKCKVLDLQIPAMLHSPLSPFAFSRGKGSKSVAAVRRIPRVAKTQVLGAVTKALQKHIPEAVSLSVSEHEVKGQKDLVTLSWHIDGRLSLKGLMRTYGLPTINLADVWPVPKHGEEEPWDLRPQPIHAQLETMCDRIMADPNSVFWRYAELDIWYLKVLEERLGFPQPDHHSDCVAAVAYTKFYGFGLDIETLNRTKEKYERELTDIERGLGGLDLKSSKARLGALQALDPLIQASNKKVLEAAVQAERPCAPLAAKILGYGPARQRLLQVQKLLALGRAHPDFRVMGTATARMGGSGGLNFQGIGKPTADGLCARAGIRTVYGGDFSSFEVCIAAAAYNDAQIQADLDAGIDLHSMAVSIAHPEALKLGLSYEQIHAAVKAKDPKVGKWRGQMKGVVFGIFYGAQKTKVAEVLNVSEAEGQRVLDLFCTRYAGIGKFRSEIVARFQTADTDRWNKQSVSYMHDSMADMTGFKRSWAFEKAVACTMWDLGSKGVRTGLSGAVIRNREKGAQPIDQAVRSALLGSAIAIQAAVGRQAGNMPIQATGANLCKMLMAEIWNALKCPMMQIHDEIVAADHPNFDQAKVVEIIKDFETRWKVRIPSIKFDHGVQARWSDK